MAQLLHERGQQRTPLGELLACEHSGEEFAHGWVVGDPQEETIVGLEPEQLLQHGQAQNLAVVHVGHWPSARDQLAIAALDLGFGKCIVERAVKGSDGVFETQGGGSRHVKLS
ncbi:MAG: hypothetical protein NTW87_10870 [Planctomycetota bacterium]|nr:hypothetical protein [Planctomycetota bacterium]